MTKLKNSFYVKVISSIVVFTFLTLDISRAGSFITVPPQTLAAETAFQLRTQEFTESILFQAPVLNSILHIGKYLLEDLKSVAVDERLESLKSVVGHETASPNLDIEKVIDLDHVKFHPQNENVIIIPYRTDGEKTVFVHIALKKDLSPNDMAEYKWIISDKYAVTILSESEEDSQPKVSVKISTSKSKETQPVISEKPIAEIEIEEPDVSSESTAPPKTKTVIIEAITLALFLVIAIPIAIFLFLFSTVKNSPAENISPPPIVYKTPKPYILAQGKKQDNTPPLPAEEKAQLKEENMCAISSRYAKIAKEMIAKLDLTDPNDYLTYRNGLKNAIKGDVIISAVVSEYDTGTFIDEFEVTNESISSLNWMRVGNTHIEYRIHAEDIKKPSGEYTFRATAEDVESIRKELRRLMKGKDLTKIEDIKKFMEAEIRTFKPGISVTTRFTNLKTEAVICKIFVSGKKIVMKDIEMMGTKNSAWIEGTIVYSYDMDELTDIDSKEIVDNLFNECQVAINLAKEDFNLSTVDGLTVFKRALAMKLHISVFLKAEAYDKVNRFLGRFIVSGGILRRKNKKPKTDKINKENDSMLNIKPNENLPPANMSSLPEEIIAMLSDIKKTAPVTVHQKLTTSNITTIPNNKRTQLVNAGNQISAFLFEKEKRELPPINRDDATAQIVENLENTLTELDTSKSILPKEIETVRNDVRMNLGQLGVTGMLESIEILARAAKRTGQNLVIGIDPSWIPGYESGKLQHAAMNPLINELNSIEGILKKKNLKNVRVIINEDPEKRSAWTSEMEKALNSPGDFSNLITIGDTHTSKHIEDTLLQKISRDKRPLIAEINPINLMAFYTAHGEDENWQMDIDLVEFISITVDLAIGNSVPDLADLHIRFDKKFNKIYYFPDAKKINYKENRKKNKLNKTTLKSL